MRHSIHRTCRACRGLRRDCAAAAAVEFALVMPLLLLVLIGMVVFGLTFNNYTLLTDAVRAGARQFATSRNQTSTPLTATETRVQNSAPSLTQTDLTIALSVNGARCTSDAACQAALANGQGLPAQVMATYPCNLTFLGHDFAPGCLLTAQTTELIQ
jgi:Flp pilus assembly protein TadG